MTFHEAWDFVEMSTSKDGLTWTPPTVVLRPTTVYDKSSVCGKHFLKSCSLVEDPAVVKLHGVYFMYHTCINVDTPPDGYKNNRICVAMSDKITGPVCLYVYQLIC